MRGQSISEYAASARDAELRQDWLRATRLHEAAAKLARERNMPMVAEKHENSARVAKVKFENTKALSIPYAERMRLVKVVAKAYNVSMYQLVYLCQSSQADAGICVRCDAVSESTEQDAEGVWCASCNKAGVVGYLRLMGMV